jgi:hypothetical protein
MNITIQYIDNNEVKKLTKLKKIRCISYSLISRSMNEQEVLDYLKMKEILNINLAYGKQAHAIISDENYQHQASTSSYIDTENKQIYLSYHQISETVLMKLALMQNKRYKTRHAHVEFEKKMYIIINYNKYKLLCKAYLDAYNFHSNVVLEFKTTSHMFNLMNTINKYNYDLQAYIYCKIIQHNFNHIPDFEFFFLNKSKNDEVRCIMADRKILAYGKNKLINYLPNLIKILEKHNYIYQFNCLN